MVLQTLSSLRRKLISKQAGRISFTIDLEGGAVILSSVLLADQHLIPYDLREFVVKKREDGLVVDSKQRLILRKRYPLAPGSISSRQAYREFSSKIKELLDELLWQNLGL